MVFHACCLCASYYHSSTTNCISLFFSNLFFIQPYVVVESLTNEWGSLGQYFVFDPSVWVANFGSFTNLRSVANNVKVCRSGVEIWTGDITAFALTAFADNNIGRREPDSAAGDWEVNDVIVPSSTSCPVVSMYYMILMREFLNIITVDPYLGLAD